MIIKTKKEYELILRSLEKELIHMKKFRKKTIKWIIEIKELEILIENIKNYL